MRDGDSKNNCIVICLQTTNEPRRKSKRNRTNPPLNVNDDGTWINHKKKSWSPQDAASLWAGKSKNNGQPLDGAACLHS